MTQQFHPKEYTQSELTTCLRKNLYMNVHSGTIHDSWNVETTQIFPN